MVICIFRCFKQRWVKVEDFCQRHCSSCISHATFLMLIHGIKNSKCGQKICSQFHPLSHLSIKSWPIKCKYFVFHYIVLKSLIWYFLIFVIQCALQKSIGDRRWTLKYRILTCAIQALRGANKRRQFLVQLLDL